MPTDREGGKNKKTEHSPCEAPARRPLPFVAAPLNSPGPLSPRGGDGGAGGALRGPSCRPLPSPSFASFPPPPPLLPPPPPSPHSVPPVVPTASYREIAERGSGLPPAARALGARRDPPRAAALADGRAGEGSEPPQGQPSRGAAPRHFCFPRRSRWCIVGAQRAAAPPRPARAARQLVGQGAVRSGGGGTQVEASRCLPRNKGGLL